MARGSEFKIRAGSVAFWTVPPLLSVLLYWPGLTAWFQKDDFVWLGLRGLVDSWSTFWWALFAPLAQGTIRTLSERVYFLSLSTAFGVQPLPFRLVAFATHAASVTLLSSVCTKLTGSRAAGFCAAILWTVNSALAVPLSWTAVYYQLSCSFVFLLAFWLLLRYVETGERRFFSAQWIVFVLGFGVLELNVVYPALAAAYAVCCAPKILRKILPMFAVSAAYTVVHFVVAPAAGSGPYRMYWDLGTLKTLATYSNWALGTGWLFRLDIHSFVVRMAIGLPLAAGLFGFLIWKLRQRNWMVAIFPAWFLIVLAPLLPLRDHMMHEYLTVPLIGIAMWGGWAIASGWKGRLPARIAALVLAAAYVAISAPVAWSVTNEYHDRAERIHGQMLDVARFYRQHPNEPVFLTGVNHEFFWDAIYHHAFRPLGVPDPHLPAESRTSIEGDAQLGPPPEEFFANVPANARIFDIGSRYPSKVEIGNPAFSGKLGDTWYASEGSFRWMPKQATVTLNGPRDASAKLHLTGFCPPAALKAGPLHVEVRVEGEALPVVSIRNAGEFSLVLELPTRLRGRPTVEVAVELERTFSVPPDTRQLGLAFESFEIR